MAFGAGWNGHCQLAASGAEWLLAPSGLSVSHSLLGVSANYQTTLCYNAQVVTVLGVPSPASSLSFDFRSCKYSENSPIQSIPSQISLIHLPHSTPQTTRQKSITFFTLTTDYTLYAIDLKLPSPQSPDTPPTLYVTKITPPSLKITSFAISSEFCCVLTTLHTLHLFKLYPTSRDFSIHSIPIYIPLTYLRNPQTKFDRVVAGTRHFLMLDTKGNLFSVGCGVYGQLGHGTIETTTVWENFMEDFDELVLTRKLGRDSGFLDDGPVFLEVRCVEALMGVKIVEISAGCWHSAVISEFGDVYTFGYNMSGQLGIQSSTTLESSFTGDRFTGNTAYPVLTNLDLSQNSKDHPRDWTVACGAHFTVCSDGRSVWMAGKFNRDVGVTGDLGEEERGVHSDLEELFGVQFGDVFGECGNKRKDDAEVEVWKKLDFEGWGARVVAGFWHLIIYNQPATSEESRNM
ncbi:RCC1 domain-containing protein 1 [Nowakowskiella sp. JEL0407]|nr:RCC1 domain-containing protein 1 [Nowakowskiella sp. JEL0407]